MARKPWLRCIFCSEAEVHFKLKWDGISYEGRSGNAAFECTVPHETIIVVFTLNANVQTRRTKMTLHSLLLCVFECDLIRVTQLGVQYCSNFVSEDVPSSNLCISDLSKNQSAQSVSPKIS